MIKILISSQLILLSFLSLNTEAQNGDEIEKKHANHFLEIGLGLNYHAVRDKGTSPLIYKGYLPSIHLQYFFTNDRFLGILEENFFMGNLQTRNFSSSDNTRALSYNNEFSFNGSYKISNLGKVSLYAGGELGTLVNFRVNDKFNNADLNYDLMGYLAPSAMLEYKTSWQAGILNMGLFSLKKRDRNFKLQYALTIPVINMVLRPGYVTISDFVDNNSLSVEANNLKVTSFDHLFLMKNKIIAYYILHNNNMLKFNYGFNYFSYYRNYNPVKGFYSSFMISVVFRFSDN